MRLIAIAAACFCGIVAVFAGTLIWFDRAPHINIIPPQFRGTWLDAGSECADSDAQAVVSGNSIRYDRLNYVATNLVEAHRDAVVLDGESFPDGRTDREIVKLRIINNGTRLVIDAPNTASAPLVRCAGIR